MKDFGLVSIITPTYNCGKYISDTIKSVLGQTYKNWELIIVDDHSTDITSSVVNKYASNDNRIRYYQLSKNSGAATARNLALKKANGRWIAFLDSDDIWAKDKLELQLKFMINGNYSFSYTDYEEITEQGNSNGIIVRGPKKITRFGMVCYCWPGCLTVMYDQDVLGLIQIPNIKKNNDYAIWLMASKIASCYRLPLCLAYYRKREGSISSHSKLNLIKWHYRLFRKVENRDKLTSIVLTFNNLLWGAIKKIFFVKSISYHT